VPPRRRKRLLLLVLSLPVLVLAAVNLVGALLPHEHVVASRAAYPVSPDSVWKAISDFAGSPAWRPDLQRVDRLPDRDGHPVWLEVGMTGEVPYEVLAFDPPHTLTVRTADPGLPFRGRWHYQVDPMPAGCTLTITEWGEIHGGMYRFLARFAFGYASKVDGVLRALGNRFGVAVTPEHVNPDPNGAGVLPGG